MRRQTWNIMTLNVLVQKRKILVVMGFRGRIIKEVLMVRPAWSKWMALGNSLWREAFMCVCVWLIFMINFMNVRELMSSWFPLLHSHEQYVEYVCEKLLFSSVSTFKVGTDTEPFFINYFFWWGGGANLRFLHSLEIQSPSGTPLKSFLVQTLVHSGGVMASIHVLFFHF